MERDVGESTPVDSELVLIHFGQLNRSGFAGDSNTSTPASRPACARRDEELRGEIQRVWKANVEVYGVRKVWRQLK